MHTDNENGMFPITKVSQLDYNCYAYLGRDWDEFFFLKKTWSWELVLKRIEELDDSAISDRMWEWFDDYQARKDAVASWDTEDSYDNWRSDIDIWDYECSADYHDCPQEIVDILGEMEFWGWEYADYDWYYLDTYDTSSVTRQNLERYYRNMNLSQEFNSALWADLTKEYHINELEFLACEDIR